MADPNLAQRIVRRIKFEGAKRKASALLGQVPPDDIERHRGAVLFFEPEAGLSAHQTAALILARSLMDRGRKVVVARCVSLFERCQVMAHAGLSADASAADKRAVCAECVQTSVFFADSLFGVPALDLRRFQSADLMADYASVTGTLPDELQGFTYDNVAFGDLCAHDIALVRKVSRLDPTDPDIRAQWTAHIRSAVMSYMLARAANTELGFSHFVHYGSYSILSAAHVALTRAGVPCTVISHTSHKSLDHQKIDLYPDFYAISAKALGARWSEVRELALPGPIVLESCADITENLKSTHTRAFSPPKSFTVTDYRKDIGIPTGRKILAAYTSSLDEFTAEGMLMRGIGRGWNLPLQPFPDQIAWLLALAKFVEERSDLFLVVRIHPREGSTRPGAPRSQHLAQLRENFDRELPNCRFVWPEEPVSSFDLAEVADVGLTSWSTIGIQLARMGLPVLTSTSGLESIPPDDFSEWGAKSDAYFAKLDELLVREPCFATFARAYRWYTFNYLTQFVDISDIVPLADYTGIPVYRTPREADTIDKVIAGGCDLLTMRIDELKARQSESASREEQKALRSVCRRLVRFLLTGDVEAPDRPLAVLGPDSAPGGDSAIRCSADGTVTYTDGPVQIERYSPMCARLAQLLSQP